MKLVMLYNIAVVSCFTALAVIFNKWWIILFSCLIIMTWKSSSNDEKEDKDEPKSYP